MVELTNCFESNFVDASTRKTAKYHHLLEEMQSKWYEAHNSLPTGGVLGHSRHGGF